MSPSSGGDRATLAYRQFGLSPKQCAISVPGKFESASKIQMKVSSNALLGLLR
jgi:hypothetical protein